jgi:hypothetical protein
MRPVYYSLDCSDRTNCAGQWVQSSRKRGLHRRQDLKAAVAAAATPFFIPARLLGADAPSKLVMGFIGVGWMGGESLSAFLGQSDCRVVDRGVRMGVRVGKSLQGIGTRRGRKGQWRVRTRRKPW